MKLKIASLLVVLGSLLPVSAQQLKLHPEALGRITSVYTTKTVGEVGVPAIVAITSAGTGAPPFRILYNGQPGNLFRVSVTASFGSPITESPLTFGPCYVSWESPIEFLPAPTEEVGFVQGWGGTVAPTGTTEAGEILNSVPILISGSNITTIYMTCTVPSSYSATAIVEALD